MLLRELEEFPDMQTYAFLVNDVLGTNIPNNVVAYHHSRYECNNTHTHTYAQPSDGESQDDK